MVCCEGGFPQLILCVKKRKERVSHTDETGLIPNHGWTPAPVKPVQGRTSENSRKSILKSTSMSGVLIMFLPQPESPKRCLTHTRTHTHAYTPHLPIAEQRNTHGRTVSLNLYHGCHYCFMYKCRNKKGSVQGLPCGSQELRLCPPNGGDLDSMPGQGTRSHMLLLTPGTAKQMNKYLK